MGQTMPYDATIAVAKGRTLTEVQTLWTKVGWDWPQTSETRRLWFPAGIGHPGLVIVRGVDIPMLVQRGIAEFGIVGRDILAEYPAEDVLEVLDLTIAKCRLTLAGRDGRWPNGPVRVATTYPRVAQQFFRSYRHPAEIIPLSGSVELAPSLGLASHIVDVVQTGTTLREHGLKEIATIFPSSARLIANAAVWRTRQESAGVFEHLKSWVLDGSENMLGPAILERR